MIVQKSEKERSNDFLDLYRRYETLDNGLKASIRRVTEPEELRDTMALYRLFYQARPQDNWLRVTFLLPWCGQCKVGAEALTPSFGAQFGRENVNEMRILQIARTKEPFGIIQLRHLAMQVKPVVDWARFGATLFWWTKEDKRGIIEDFYYSQIKNTRKGVRS